MESYDLKLPFPSYTFSDTTGKLTKCATVKHTIKIQYNVKGYLKKNATSFIV